jgi:hypothetical protein
MITYHPVGQHSPLSVGLILRVMCESFNKPSWLKKRWPGMELCQGFGINLLAV